MTCTCATSSPPSQATPRARDGWDSAPLIGAAPSAASPTGVASSAVAAPPTGGVASAVAAPPASGGSATVRPVLARTFPGSHFPPAALTPPYARTQKPGDGQWAPLLELAAEAQPSIYRTTLHPHKFKGFVYLTVLAFDLTAVELTLVAGKLEPQTERFGDAQRPAVVPPAAYDNLLMVLNGGFKTRHGHYGMQLAGVPWLPPKEAACTVAQYRDGRLRVGSWSRLSAAFGAMDSYRQTPPCLLERGQRNADLPSEFRTRLWGAAKGGARDIRRSALGLDQSGRTLFFALGDWITAGELADAMSVVGAYDAAQLDINWSYTRAFTFERRDGVPRIARSLVPELKFSRDRYIGKRSQRDFYYVTRRGGPAAAAAPR